jgi:hypothetical protein
LYSAREMMIAILIAAGAAAQPPAKLHIPKAVRDARSGEQGEEAAPLSVFAAPDVLLALGPPRPLVGAWAEYAVRARGREDVRVKLSILPPALEGGRYWMELDVATPTGTPSAVRLLVHGSPGRAQDLERVTVFVPGQAALEIPLDEVRQNLSPEDEAKPSGAAIRKRKPETVKTAAGSFANAEVIDVADTRIWRSEKVPLWGLVQSKSRAQTVELIGYASAGAHTLIQGNGSDSVK